MSDKNEMPIQMQHFLKFQNGGKNFPGQESSSPIPYLRIMPWHSVE
jgi:hypothetical protein